MVQVRLPDGTEKQFESPVTPLDVAADIGPGLAKAALAATVDDKVVGLDYVLPSETTVNLSLLTKKDRRSTRCHATLVRSHYGSGRHAFV